MSVALLKRQANAVKKYSKSPRGIATRKKWEAKNNEKIRDTQKKSKKKNKDKIAAASKNYRNTEIFREKRRYRYSSDLAFRLRDILRSRILNALKGRKKSAPTFGLLGCPPILALLIIEAQFWPGMTWNNWTIDGWHLDHKKPLISFDLDDPNQLTIACHISNLQPLWAEDNLKKGGKIVCC